MRCRHCGGADFLPFLNLGAAPPSNAYIDPRTIAAEKSYPLEVRTCRCCWLTQTRDFAARETFFTPEYAYFSSFSPTWLAHAEAYVAMMRHRFALGPDSLVCEVAANDGYLLRYVQAAGIRCYGIEPTAGTAAAARALGIEMVEAFFGRALATKLAADNRRADLMVANNVLAHVPDINDFAAGFATLLKPEGVATFEFPHLLEMVEGAQFDTAYHEHYSYLSLCAVERIFAAAGLRIFDIETTPWHGGSLRVFACRAAARIHKTSAAVAATRRREVEAGMRGAAFYGRLQPHADRVREELRTFLAAARREGLQVAAYGAAAKGNTLLNFSGVTAEDIAFVADRNPHKQGQLLPGSHIPVVSEAELAARRPDRVLILPWNLEAEIKSQLAYVTEWGGRFVTAIPTLKVHA
ncbi:class I SAM-dependent methyltransferase [Pseudohoeflea sp. DP4N28-3]|uniref:Class I SAM-dependent methyltransferase n=2 Tax=Pseudohoeflea coraliihabitans TaxID=2860393 RepID=A0ABS6WNG4_9HYPH|nr:class I SAM-dependent methyltransferase [Pseudohoeflea sp. DP4N28-3]MBW3097509.1 class I SAM-dependent methyltransferase [Pseudohoeflea sp. DP4N28-3]